VDRIQGTVSRVNGHGFTLAGRDGWLNISKYAPAEDVPMPTQGAVVSLQLDAKGFVRRIAAEDTPPRVQGRTAPMGRGGRDQSTITRLAVLNTSTAILSSGQRAADPAAVLALAEDLERWATR
jgi:hypothetical protein